MATRLYTPQGWFNGDDDSEPALIHAERADDAISLTIERQADWLDGTASADAYLSPADALRLAGQLERAAEDAIAALRVE